METRLGHSISVTQQSNVADVIDANREPVVWSPVEGRLGLKSSERARSLSARFID